MVYCPRRSGMRCWQGEISLLTVPTSLFEIYSDCHAARVPCAEKLGNVRLNFRQFSFFFPSLRPLSLIPRVLSSAKGRGCNSSRSGSTDTIFWEA